MATHDLRHTGEAHASAQDGGFWDSFALFAMIVMGTFAIAIALAIVGAVWLS